MSISGLVNGVISFFVVGDNAISAEEAGKNNGAQIVSASGQIIATIASITPTGAIATTPGAAVVTAMKITIDVQSGNGVSWSDVASLIGNVVSFVGGVAFFVPGGASCWRSGTCGRSIFQFGGLVS